MTVPKRPTAGQKAAITRGLNLQVATKKDVEQLKRRLDELQELIARGQKQVLRDVKRAIAKAAAKKA